MNIYTMRLIKALYHETIKASSTTSAWKRGVKAYAFELLENIMDAANDDIIRGDDIMSPAILQRAMLNGASNWTEYSEGGCSLIYDGDIAARLCTKTEYKRVHGGRIAPNARETWIDVQARALWQAADIILTAARNIPERIKATAV